MQRARKQQQTIAKGFLVCSGAAKFAVSPSLRVPASPPLMGQIPCVPKSPHGFMPVGL